MMRVTLHLALLTANMDGTITPGFWRAGNQLQLRNNALASRSMTIDAANIRNKLVDYFNSAQGSVGWQNAHIYRH